MTDDIIENLLLLKIKLLEEERDALREALKEISTADECECGKHIATPRLASNALAWKPKENK